MAKGFNSIAEINAATTYNMWELGHNFTDYNDGASPPECDAVSDGTAFKLQRLGANTPTKLAAPQARYLDQGAMRVDVANGLMYKGADANWNVDATVPTAYIIHFRMDASDSTEQTIFSGLSGFGSEGWRITVKGSGAGAGVKLYVMGTGSTVPTSSANVCDGKEHTVLLVIDDANGRATLVTEWGTVAITGLTYSQSGDLLCTVGPTHTGDTWTKATSYFWAYKGKHANAYTDAANIYARLALDINAKSMGIGGIAENEGDEEVGTTAGGSNAGAFHGFDAEWDDTPLEFTGSATFDVPAAVGTFESLPLPVSFTGGATLEAPTAKGVIVKSAWARTRHVDAAVARIVGQLIGNYNPATFEAIAQNVELAAPTAAGAFEIGS